MLAPDYDASDSTPVSEQIASSYADAEEDSPWKDICCDLAPRRLNAMEKERYVRQGPLASNVDKKLYDAGNMFVCTVDGTAVPWGKLWVEYDVTLFTPQAPSGGFQGASSIQATATTGQTGAAPFGSTAINAIGAIEASAVTKTVSMPHLNIGSEIQVTVALTGTVISAAALNNLVGLTLKNTLFAGFPAAATSAALTSTYTVSAEVASFDVAMTATTITQCIVTVGYLAPQPVF